MLSIQMKKNLKYIALAFSAVALAGCADLDTEYQGDYISADQNAEVQKKAPEQVVAGVTSIVSNFYTYMTTYSQHFDFGYPAIMLGFDLQTADLFGAQSGYNWFTYWEGYTSPTPTGVPTQMCWNNLYSQIKTANDQLKVLGEATADEDASMPFYRAQAHAVRAFDYWVLAQVYQFNYKTHADAPCVPIVTDKNDTEIEKNGAPRASVKDVYDLILSDLNTAIDYLSSTSVKREDVIASKPKRLVSLAVAYGLRARAYLSMGKYAEALADCQAAIKNHDGATYSRSEVSKPGFNDMSDGAWMWGIAVTENDRVVTSGIVNFPSQMCTFFDGYTSVGAWRFAAKDLYDAINSTDVRKGWWLNSNKQSPNISDEQKNYLKPFADMTETYNSSSNAALFPYTNVKYGTYNNELPGTLAICDIPLMRVEEMFLIQAECMAMTQGVTAGKEALEKFVRSCRDPKYEINPRTAEDVQDAVFFQRRVELWGEGLVFFDYMRLGKDVDRRRAHAPVTFTYNIKAGDPVLLYCIPNSEITANRAISDADNNPSASRPSAVSWEN